MILAFFPTFGHNNPSLTPYKDPRIWKLANKIFRGCLLALIRLALGVSIWVHICDALLVSQERRHLFVTLLIVRVRLLNFSLT